MPEHTCVVGLGANLGDAVATFTSAIASLAQQGRIRGVSNLYQTAAIGGPAQPDYFNAAVLLSTCLTPQGLLQQLQKVEAVHGRERSVRWGPRTLDLDLLWIEGLRVDEPGLSVPHPRLTERGFALLPLLDLVPAAREPITERPYAEMRKNLSHQGVRRHGIARPRTDDWLADSASSTLWQIADLGL